MKVAWIVPGFSRDEQDWCIPALLDLARAMAKQCELHIVALRYPFRRDVYRIGEATVHSIGGGNRGGRFTPPIWLRAAKVLNQLDFEVVHAFWAYEPGILAAGCSGRAPVVISLAGGELADLRQIGYGLAGKRSVRLLMRWAMRHARIVTAGSSLLLEMGRRFAPECRWELAPLGVDPARWNNAPPGESSFTLLNVGSLEPVKGQAFLLRAFRQVACRFPSARLAVAGSGQLDKPLRRLVDELGIAGSVSLCGGVAHDDLPKLYQAATLFVQSSLHEAQGMALLEAAACGRPAVGTSVGALADLAPEAAIATPIGDIDRLAAAIIELLDDPIQAGNLGRAARALAIREYSVERSAERFMALYHESLG